MTKEKFSKHFVEDRADRYVVIATKVGLGEIHRTRVTSIEGKSDRVLELTTTGVIIVRAMDRTVITVYCATISNAKYICNGEKLPHWLYKTILKNQEKGYCYM